MRRGMAVAGRTAARLASRGEPLRLVVRDASRAPSGYHREAWISTYTAIAAGELERVTDTVARLTGHEPLSLEQYLRTA
jgi:NAD(P)H dehydrogenase (quinone)